MLFAIVLSQDGIGEMKFSRDADGVLVIEDQKSPAPWPGSKYTPMAKPVPGSKSFKRVLTRKSNNKHVRITCTISGPKVWTPEQRTFHLSWEMVNLGTEDAVIVAAMDALDAHKQKVVSSTPKTVTLKKGDRVELSTQIQADQTTHDRISTWEFADVSLTDTQKMGGDSKGSSSEQVKIPSLTPLEQEVLKKLIGLKKLRESTYEDYSDAVTQTARLLEKLLASENSHKQYVSSVRKCHKYNTFALMAWLSMNTVSKGDSLSKYEKDRAKWWKIADMELDKILNFF